jgi:hypothetical protein
MGMNEDEFLNRFCSANHMEEEMYLDPDEEGKIAFITEFSDDQTGPRDINHVDEGEL